MSTILDEDLYYQYNSQAINQPLEFLKALHSLRKNAPVPQNLIALNAVNAYMGCGRFKQAVQELEALAPLVKKGNQSFSRCLYHLLNFRICFNIHNDQQRAEEELEKAAGYQKLSGSSALEAELLLGQFVRDLQASELTRNEELLQKAMNAAVRAARQELILDVYLGFIQLYLSNNLPEQANRELLLVQEMVLPEQNPMKHVLLLNLRGIIHTMMRSFEEAGTVFETAAKLAEKHGYFYQLAQIYMNLGISLVNRGEFSPGISMYDRSLELISASNGIRLPLEGKIISNKARALSMCDRIPEAIALMEAALASPANSINPREQNILRVNLADSLIEVEQYDRVPALLDEATHYFEGNKIWDLVQNCHLCRARLFEARQEYQSAFESMEELWQASRKNFQENFASQSRRYRQRIEELRNEYFLLKNQCVSLEQTALKDSKIALIGEHPLIKKALANAIQAAKYPFVNVHIYGETGTGKEIIARLIHDNSQSSRPLVAINASAISPNLIESELFGHVRGAFTGAVSDHKGKFVLANGGTLFLDEISEMPLDCQAKLLRAIEHQSIIPVGSDKELKVNCRIVSASNRKLSDLLRTNQFRLDLYHRLNKVEIYLPPLRERLSDLPALTDHFVRRFSREFGHGMPVIEDSFRQRLQQHSFPGNVRELMNIIERIFILKPKPHWDADQLDGLIDLSQDSFQEPGDIAQNLKQKERQLIIDTLDKVGWKQKEAALLLNMTESTLSRHIKKLGIQR